MQIILHNHVQQILTALVHSQKGVEWTAFGKTRLTPAGDIEILEIRIPHHTSTAGDTEWDDDDNEQFLIELAEAGENPKEWNCWIHSHHSMGLFWSGTDKQQFENFNNGCDWFCHVVVNYEGMKGAVTQYKPFKLYNEDVTVRYYLPDGSLTAEIDNVIKVLKTELEEIDKELELKKAPITERINQLEAERKQITSVDVEPWEKLIAERNRRVKFGVYTLDDDDDSQLPGGFKKKKSKFDQFNTNKNAKRYAYDGIDGVYWDTVTGDILDPDWVDANWDTVSKNIDWGTDY